MFMRTVKKKHPILAGFLAFALVLLMGTGLPAVPAFYIKLPLSRVFFKSLALFALIRPAAIFFINAASFSKNLTVLF